VRLLRLLIGNEISQDAVIATNVSNGAGIAGNDHVKKYIHLH